MRNRDVLMYSLLFLFPLLSLSGENFIKKIKTLKQFEFKVDTNNLCSFGYEDYDMDQDQGIKALFRYGDSIYFIDNYHKNIKILDIQTGKLTCSEPILLWPNDIYVTSQYIFVLGDAVSDGLLVLNHSMQKLKHITSLPGGIKYFVKQKNKVYILNESDRKETKYKVFSLNDILHNDTLKVKYLNLNLWDFMYFEQNMNNGVWFIDRDSFQYELPRKLEEPFEEYDARYIYMTSNEIVHFFSTKKKVIITLITY